MLPRQSAPEPPPEPGLPLGAGLGAADRTTDDRLTTLTLSSYRRGPDGRRPTHHARDRTVPNRTSSYTARRVPRVPRISACNRGSDQGRLAQRTTVIPPESVVARRCPGPGRRCQRWERLDREGEHDA
ncbi:hypothetical protein TPA0907_05180 [Micromonospora humidisoli]|nr:hypothetical protein TPA0907_05180 [Micromonospora sp. AKA109]